MVCNKDNMLLIYRNPEISFFGISGGISLDMGYFGISGGYFGISGGYFGISGGYFGISGGVKKNNKSS